MEKIENLINELSANYGILGLVLVGAIIVFFIIQIALYLGLYRRIAKFRLTKRKPIREKEPAISIVVPLFAEDYDYLDNSLTTLLTQDYKQFEVIVVYVGKNARPRSFCRNLQ